MESRFRRIAAGSTTSDSSDPASACSAPPVYASAPESAAGSACQTPAARSCSPTSARTSTPACAAASSAHARASVAPTGLRLCGIVDEPPASPSAASPTSVCASSCTSSAIFAAHAGSRPERGAELGDAAPVGVPREGRNGQPELARVGLEHGNPPVAEPRERAPPRRRAVPRAVRDGRGRAHARAPTTATSQPAAFRPNVVGTACWRSVRAAIGVERCSRASVAQAAATRSASPRIVPSAARATSIAAVSTTSWLVAPRCTQEEASGPTASASARTSGSAAFPLATTLDGQCLGVVAARRRRRCRSRPPPRAERPRRPRRPRRARAPPRASPRATRAAPPMHAARPARAERRPLPRRDRRRRGPLSPHLLGDLDDQRELCPLLVLAELVALDRRGEAALRGEAELLQR